MARLIVASLTFLICLNLSVCADYPKTFPDNFQFGVATAAYQIEGAWNADGKGASIWDTVTHTHPEYIEDKQNADIACDSYNKWEEDIELIKKLDVSIYRFSLSWPRILPNGYANKINQNAVKYYNNVINKLLENGIEPMVTLYHWDLPQNFAALGGWSNSALVGPFADYARVAFELFGDRVKLWLTFNEPRLVCDVFKGTTSYGINEPHFPLGVIEYMCAHTLVKAHAEAYHIYDREFRYKQKGKISITIDHVWTEPVDNSPENEAMAEQRRQFDFGLYANPIFNYDYPQVVIDRVAYRSKIEGFRLSRLPQFTLAEKFKIRGTYDFIGINHYVTFMGKVSEDAPSNQTSTDIDGGGTRYFSEKWSKTPAYWIFNTPWGLRNLLKWVKETYNNPEIYITESGYADNTTVFDDYDRINYVQNYLNATLQAIHIDKVNVKAFMYWSLMDNFEWTNGYSLKFGLVHVDFNSLNRTRTLRKSYDYYKQIAQTKSLQ